MDVCAFGKALSLEERRVLVRPIFLRIQAMHDERWNQPFALGSVAPLTFRRPDGKSLTVFRWRGWGLKPLGKPTLMLVGRLAVNWEIVVIVCHSMSIIFILLIYVEMYLMDI